MTQILESPLRLRPAPAGFVPEVETLGKAIAWWAGQQPAQPALVDLERTLCWAQLHACVEAIGKDLARLGLGATHRVGLVVPEGLPGGQLVLGLCCHCVLVPINPALTPTELIETASQTGLDALVVPQPLLAEVDLAGLEGLLTLEAHVPQGAVMPALRACVEPVRRAPSHGAPAGTMVLLRSSGTTGTPKLVPVTHRNMLAMAAKMASPAWFGLGPQDRAASILPLYYAAGLKTLLLVPVLLGGSVAFAPPGRGFFLAEWLLRLAPTYICTTPATLRGMVERLPGDMAGSTLRFIACGGAFVPDDLRQAVEASFKVPLVEFYGLSEAGVMAANSVGPGHVRLGTVGRAMAGELRIVDSQRRPLPPGEAGEILIGGPSVCPGYLRPGGPLSDDVQDGMLLTGDIGRLDADGFLSILGRDKEVINRGGEKVFPYEVEKALLAHGDVLEAAVYGVPHPRLGQGVGAAVVLKPDRSTSAREISAWLATRVALYKIPRGLRIVSRLPKGKTGKVLRSMLAELHREQPAARGKAGDSADSLLQHELLGLWREMLGTDEVGIDDDFFDLGGDSLLAADLLMDIELLTGVSTVGWDLSSLTVRDVCHAVLHSPHGDAGIGADLLTQARAGHGAPLFFCHGDIASRGIYAHRLTEHLPTSNPVWLLNSPDRQAGLGIEAAASAYLDEVMRVLGNSPSPSVCVAGWCNGGLVAWHLAHLLRAHGVEVTRLFLIETPSWNADGGLRRMAQALRRTGAWVPGRAGRFVRDEAMRGVWALRRKGLSEFSAALLRHLRGKPYALARDTWTPQSLRETSVLYYQRIARYVPPRLDVPVTCFVAEHGDAVDTDPSRWRPLAPSLRVVHVPGTHYSAVVGHRATLAARLAECMGDLPSAATNR